MLSIIKKTCLSLGAASLLFASPAFADLESNLKHTPQRAALVININTDYQEWKYFLTRPPFEKGFQDIKTEIAKDLQKNMGIDFETEILPMLGTHLTLGFYDEKLSPENPFPLLVSLDLKETSGYQTIIKRLQRSAQANPAKSLVSENYRNLTLYGLRNNKEPNSPYFTLSGQTLLFGSKALIKQALDTAATPPRSISQLASFQTTQKALGKQKLWLYLNPEYAEAFMKSAPIEKLTINNKPVPAKERAQASKNLKAALEVYESLGFGFDLNANGLVIKGLANYKQKGLAANKQAYVQDLFKLWKTAGEPLRPFLQAAPARPLFFASLDGVKLYERSLQVFGSLDAANKEVTQSLEQGFQKFTGLNFKLDLLQHSDGRGAIAVFYSEGTTVFDRPPQVIVMMGAQNNAAILKNLTQKLKIDLSAMAADQRSAKAAKEVIAFPTKPNSTYQKVPLFIAKENATAKGLQQSLFVRPSYANLGKVWLFASNPEALKSGIDYLQAKKKNLLGNLYFNQMKNMYGLQEKGSLLFMDLSQMLNMADFLAGGDDELKALRPTLSAFRSIIAGGKQYGNTIEGTFILDVNMDKVDFELLSTFFDKAAPQPVAR